MRRNNIVFAFVCFVSACNQNPKIEERIFEYKGTIKGYYLNNLENGPFIGYFPSGKIQNLWSMEKGKMEGKSMAYYLTGKLKVYRSNLNGKYHGFSYTFREDGTLKSKKLYILMVFYVDTLIIMIAKGFHLNIYLKVIQTAIYSSKKLILLIENRVTMGIL